MVEAVRAVVHDGAEPAAAVEIYRDLSGGQDD
jgi:hypothetical protein